MKKRTTVGQWKHTGCRTTPPLRMPALGHPSTVGIGCLRLRRSSAAPSALSLRPPLGARPFCSSHRPVAIKAWGCPAKRPRSSSRASQKA